MKSIIIVGASSGIGECVARKFIDMGWRVGVAARRIEALEQLQLLAPDRVFTEQIDITQESAVEKLLNLFHSMGSVDIYFHSSGIGKQNIVLDTKIETETLRTNGEGFVRMVTTAFNHFKVNGGGHIAAISSVAGTKGMGAAAAYSASKRFNYAYIDALDQLSRMEKLGISFTDIRPGFVDTPLLSGGGNYPMLMDVEYLSNLVVKSIIKRKRRAVLDWRYATLILFWRLLPQWLWVRLPIKSKR